MKAWPTQRENDNAYGWEDFDVFFDTDEFAVAAKLYCNAMKSEFDVNVILNTPGGERQFGAVVLDAESPNALVKWDPRFSLIRKGDYLTLSHVAMPVHNGQSYAVTYTDVLHLTSAVQNEGTGVCRLPLMRSRSEKLVETVAADGQRSTPQPAAIPSAISNQTENPEIVSSQDTEGDSFVTESPSDADGKPYTVPNDILGKSRS